MTELVLSLGSNCSHENVEKAIEWLASQLNEISCSGLYETPPAKGKGDNYVNAVIMANTSLQLEELNRSFKEYERRVGRDDDCRRTDCVPIDIDIVIYEGKVVREWDYRQDFFKIGYRMLTTTN